MINMKIKFNYIINIRNCKIFYNYEFIDQKVIIRYNSSEYINENYSDYKDGIYIFEDIFDFTNLPNGEVDLLSIKSTLPENPILDIWKENDILYIKLIQIIEEKQEDKEKYGVFIDIRDQESDWIDVNDFNKIKLTINEDFIIINDNISNKSLIKSSDQIYLDEGYDVYPYEKEFDNEVKDVDNETININDTIKFDITYTGVNKIKDNITLNDSIKVEPWIYGFKEFKENIEINESFSTKEPKDLIENFIIMDHMMKDIYENGKLIKNNLDTIKVKDTIKLTINESVNTFDEDFDPGIVDYGDSLFNIEIENIDINDSIEMNSFEDDSERLKDTDRFFINDIINIKTYNIEEDEEEIITEGGNI